MSTGSTQSHALHNQKSMFIEYKVNVHVQQREKKRKKERGIMRGGRERREEKGNEPAYKYT